MSNVQPIPRNGLVWLLVAQVLVILPHLSHLPNMHARPVTSRKARTVWLAKDTGSSFGWKGPSPIYP